MASNIRKCDVCKIIFRINEKSLAPNNYNKIILPIPWSLRNIIKRVKENEAHGHRGRVDVDLYDVCADCVIAICEAMLARKELDNG